MSTIYSLPLTNILVNGTKTYRIRTRDYDAILQHVEVESKTNDTINLNFEDLYFESIAFKGNSDLGETTLQAIRNTMDIKNYYTVDSRPITCAEGLKDEYLPELQFLVMRGYVIDIPMPGFATLDLNYQWRRSQTYESPLEGYTLFESASNWHVQSSQAQCYLDVDGYEGTFYYIAYGESNYDRLFMVGPNGETFSYPNSASPAILSNYKSTNFIDGRWTISYEKDGSVDSEADRGYILLPNDIQYSNEYVPVPIYVDSISISGIENISEPGSYDFAASLYPSTADTYSLGWYIDDAPTGVVARIRWNTDNPKYAYLEVDSIDEGVDSELTIVCYDDVSGVEQSYSIRIYKEAVPINVQTLTVSGPNYITEAGVYDYYVSYTPDNANNFDFQWTYSPGGQARTFSTFSVDPQNPLHGQLTVNQPSETFDEARWTILCKDNITNIEDFLLGEISIHVEPQPIHIQNITISGPNQITEPGTYDYYASYSPDNADEYDIDWSFVSGFTEEHIALQTDPSNPFHAQLVVSQPDASFSAAFAIECEDNISYNYDRFNISVDVYVEPPVEIGNIYYSSGNDEFVLDKATSTWNTKTWNNPPSYFYGEDIWTDGTNIYYSEDYNDYILDKATSTWIVKHGWEDLWIIGEFVWTDGTNIYSSDGADDYVFDKATSTWNPKTWNIRFIDGRHVWSDGENIYYSHGSQQYVLDKGTLTWVEKRWNGISSFEGSRTWTDGENIYCTTGNSAYSEQVICHVLNKATSTWSIKNWNVPIKPSGTNTWTDGDNIYSCIWNGNNNYDHYALDKATSTWSQKTFYISSWFTGQNIWSDNPQFKTSCGCHCSTFGAFNQ